MRYSPLIPRRRPMFGRRPLVETISPAGPTREERRLIDRIIRHLERAKRR